MTKLNEKEISELGNLPSNYNNKIYVPKGFGIKCLNPKCGNAKVLRKHMYTTKPRCYECKSLQISICQLKDDNGDIIEEWTPNEIRKGKKDTNRNGDTNNNADRNKPNPEQTDKQQDKNTKEIFKNEYFKNDKDRLNDLDDNELKKLKDIDRQSYVNALSKHSLFSAYVEMDKKNNDYPLIITAIENKDLLKEVKDYESKFNALPDDKVLQELNNIQEEQKDIPETKKDETKTQDDNYMEHRKQAINRFKLKNKGAENFEGMTQLRNQFDNLGKYTRLYNPEWIGGFIAKMHNSVFKAIGDPLEDDENDDLKEAFAGLFEFYLKDVKQLGAKFPILMVIIAECRIIIPRIAKGIRNWKKEKKDKKEKKETNEILHIQEQQIKDFNERLTHAEEHKKPKK